MNRFKRITEEKRRGLYYALFFILLGYLILRAIHVFYIHDELVSKWTYMVSWNYWPYDGYVDANNHFLNSLLGGMFIRLFDSDSIWLVRLPSLLGFPLYFWGIWGLRKYIRQESVFVSMFIALTCSAFLIEYFALARGYGLAMGFMLLSIRYTLDFAKNQRSSLAFWAGSFWVLCLYANLSFLTIALFGWVILAAISVVHKKWIGLLWMIIVALPMLYFVQYSFALKEWGKLYYGGSDGFFESTIHSLTPYLWGAKHWIMDAFLVLIFAGVCVTALHMLRKWKENLTHLIVLLTCIASVSGILLQHVLWEVNYPEDRTALHLVLSFILALFFALDYWRQRWLGAIIALYIIGYFTWGINLTHSVFFTYEHFDRELVTRIPDRVESTPPTIYGNWCMENEMNRIHHLPMRMFEDNGSEADTLHDFVISSLERRPYLANAYTIDYTDEISGQTLFRRKEFLKRTLRYDAKRSFNGKEEFYELKRDSVPDHLLLRVSGRVRNMDIYKEVILVTAVSDTIFGANVSYQSTTLMENAIPDAEGVVHFDCSFLVRKQPGAHSFVCSLWNKEKHQIDGDLKLHVYQLETNR